MKYILLISLLASSAAYSAQPREIYKQLEPTVQLVLTDEPCKAFGTEQRAEVYHAYAVNLTTGDKAEGCWELEQNSIVHADLVVSDEKSYFSYRYPVTDFLPRPSL